MKTRKEIIRWYVRNNPTLPVQAWIAYAMRDFGEQCFNAARQKVVDNNISSVVSEFTTFQNYMNELETKED